MPDSDINRGIISMYALTFIEEINLILPLDTDDLNLITNKIDILTSHRYQIPIWIKGYGKIDTLLKAVDEMEFYSNFLSFFHENGKIRIENSQIDNVFKQRIVISFFNIDTNQIEIITAEEESEIESNTQNAHLFWLVVMKNSIHSILIDLLNLNQTSSKIKIGSQKFKQLANNVTDNRIDSDSTTE